MQVTPIAGYPSRNATGTAVAAAVVRVSVANDGSTPAQVAVCSKGEGGDYSVAHVFSVGAGQPAVETVLTDQEPGTEFIVAVVNGALGDIRAYVGVVDSVDGDHLASIDSKLTAPISIAASSLPLPSGASTAANQAAEIASLSSIDGKTPALVGGRVPVDGSGVTQPVSGTVTANAGSGTYAVSAASLPLPSGAATETSLAAVKTAVQGTLTVGGIVAVSNQPSTYDVSDRAGRLLGVVYGSQAQQLQQSATNYNLLTELRTGGTAYDARQIRALTSSDQVTTVPSGTQTISGTVTANAGSGTFTVAGSGTFAVGGVAASGAAASGNPVLVAGSDGTNARTLKTDSSGDLVVIGAGTAGSASGGVLTVQGVASMTPLLARPSDGTNAAAVKAASTAAATTDPALVVATSSNAPSLTPAITSKSSSATSITLLTSNSARKGAGFYNNDVNDLYVNEAGGTATTSVGGFTVIIPYRGYWELPSGANGGVTTGAITGIWAAAGSSGVSITERS